MAQVAGWEIQNQYGHEVRQALNLLFQAILSTNSGAIAPETKQLGTLWADTTDGVVLKIWTGNAWEELGRGTLEVLNSGTSVATGVELLDVASGITAEAVKIGTGETARDAVRLTVDVDAATGVAVENDGDPNPTQLNSGNLLTVLNIADGLTATLVPAVPGTPADGDNPAVPPVPAKARLVWDGINVHDQENAARTLEAGESLSVNGTVAEGGTVTLDWDGFTIKDKANKARTLEAGENLTASNPSDPGGTTKLNWDGFTIKDKGNKARTLDAGENLTASNPSDAGGTTTLDWDGISVHNQTNKARTLKAGDGLSVVDIAAKGGIVELKVDSPTLDADDISGLFRDTTTIDFGTVTVGAGNAAKEYVKADWLGLDVTGDGSALTHAKRAVTLNVTDGLTAKVQTTGTAPDITSLSTTDLSWDGLTIENNGTATAKAARTLNFKSGLKATVVQTGPNNAKVNTDETTIEWDGISVHGETNKARTLKLGTGLGMVGTLSAGGTLEIKSTVTGGGGGDITAVNTTEPLQGGATTGEVNLTIDISTTGEAQNGTINNKVMTPLRSFEALKHQLVNGENTTVDKAVAGEVSVDWDGFTIKDKANKARTLEAGENLTASNPSDPGGTTKLNWDGFTIKDKGNKARTLDAGENLTASNPSDAGGTTTLDWDGISVHNQTNKARTLKAGDGLSVVDIAAKGGIVELKVDSPTLDADDISGLFRDTTTIDFGTVTVGAGNAAKEYVKADWLGLDVTGDGSALTHAKRAVTLNVTDGLTAKVQTTGTAPDITSLSTTDLSWDGLTIENNGTATAKAARTLNFKSGLKATVVQTGPNNAKVNTDETTIEWDGISVHGETNKARTLKLGTGLGMVGTLSAGGTLEIKSTVTGGGGGDITAVNTTEPLQGGATTGEVNLTIDISTTGEAQNGTINNKVMTPLRSFEALKHQLVNGENTTVDKAVAGEVSVDWDGFTIKDKANKARTLEAGENLTASNPSDPGGTTKLNWDGFTIKDKGNKARTLDAGENLTASNPSDAGGTTTLDWDGISVHNQTNKARTLKAGDGLSVVDIAAKGGIVELKVDSPTLDADDISGLFRDTTTIDFGTVTVGAGNAAKEYVKADWLGLDVTGDGSALTHAKRAVTLNVTDGLTAKVQTTGTAPDITSLSTTDLSWDGLTIENNGTATAKAARTLNFKSGLKATVVQTGPNNAKVNTDETTIEWDGISVHGETNKARTLKLGTGLGMVGTLSAGGTLEIKSTVTGGGGGDITAVNTTEPLQGGATTGEVNLTIDISTTGEAQNGTINNKVMTPLRSFEALKHQLVNGENTTVDKAVAGEVSVDWDGFTIKDKANKARTLEAGENLTASNPSDPGGTTKLNWDGFTIKDKGNKARTLDAGENLTASNPSDAGGTTTLDWDGISVHNQTNKARTLKAGDGLSVVDIAAKGGIVELKVDSPTLDADDISGLFRDTTTIDFGTVTVGAGNAAKEYVKADWLGLDVTGDGSALTHAKRAVTLNVTDGLTAKVQTTGTAPDITSLSTTDLSWDGLTIENNGTATAKAARTLNFKSGLKATVVQTGPNNAKVNTDETTIEWDGISVHGETNKARTLKLGTGLGMVGTLSAGGTLEIKSTVTGGGGGDITAVNTTEPLQGGATTGEVNLTIDISTTGEAQNGTINNKVMTPLRSFEALKHQLVNGENTTVDKAVAGEVSVDWDGFTIKDKANKARTLEAGENLTASNPSDPGGTTKLNWDGFTIKDKGNKARTLDAGENLTASNPSDAGGTTTLDWDGISVHNQTNKARTLKAGDGLSVVDIAAKGGIVELKVDSPTLDADDISGLFRDTTTIDFGTVTVGAGNAAKEYVKADWLGLDVTGDGSALTHAKRAVTLNVTDGLTAKVQTTGTAPDITSLSTTDLSWDGLTIENNGTATAKAARTLNFKSGLKATVVQTGPNNAKVNTDETTIEWDGFKVKDNVGTGNAQGDKTGVKYIKPGTNIQLDYASDDSSVTISSTPSSGTITRIEDDGVQVSGISVLDFTGPVTVTKGSNNTANQATITARAASTTQTGVVQLTNITTGYTNQTNAATPKGVWDSVKTWIESKESTDPKYIEVDSDTDGSIKLGWKGLKVKSAPIPAKDGMNAVPAKTAYINEFEAGTDLAFTHTSTKADVSTLKWTGVRFTITPNSTLDSDTADSTHATGTYKITEINIGNAATSKIRTKISGDNDEIVTLRAVGSDSTTLTVQSGGTALSPAAETLNFKDGLTAANASDTKIKDITPTYATTTQAQAATKTDVVMSPARVWDAVSSFF